MISKDKAKQIFLNKYKNMTAGKIVNWDHTDDRKYYLILGERKDRKPMMQPYFLVDKETGELDTFAPPFSMMGDISKAFAKSM